METSIAVFDRMDRRSQAEITFKARGKDTAMTSANDDQFDRIRQIQELLPSANAPTETIVLHEEPPPSRPRFPRRRAFWLGAIAAAVAATIVLAGNAIAMPWTHTSPAASPTVGFSPNPTLGASGALQTGEAFLTAWQRGDLHAAANLTDRPATALAALQDYRTTLHLSGLTLLPNPTGASGWLTYSVTAQVGSPASPWSYTSGLAAYQGTANGVPRWFVKWTPSILFTSLKPGQHLALGSLPSTAGAVDDASGHAITPANAPSLTSLVQGLEQGSGDAAAAAVGDVSGGRSGTTVQIQNSSTGSVLATVATVAKPVAGSAIRTTIDLSAEAAAQAAADRAPNSSVAVVQPSTGDILAYANNPPTGVDTAMIGALAPGSTFKVVSSTLLLNSGLVTGLDQQVQCPRVLEADGIALHNSEDEAGMDNSFLQDFAQSCNNAFSSFYQKVTTAQVAKTAQTYFGLNEPWDIGLHQPTTYAKVPDVAADSVAEEMVGQDQITASPLAMASVAATVATGGFEQPILIPGAPQVRATPLPAATLTDLRTLMHAVVTQGTLAGVITDPSGAYGKTGTAEIGTNNNSWTIAYKGDYAVCALAVDGGFGAAVAGPEVNGVLQQLAG